MEFDIDAIFWYTLVYAIDILATCDGIICFECMCTALLWYFCDVVAEPEKPVNCVGRVSHDMNIFYYFLRRWTSFVIPFVVKSTVD